MSMRNILQVLLVGILLASVLSPLRGLSGTGAQPCQMQTAGDTIELKWDDGIAANKVSTSAGGCPACYKFQGVRFTLPEGLNTAVLKSARVYAGSGKAAFRIWVTDEKGENLTPPSTFTVSGTAWYDFPLPDILVPNRFFIWVEIPEGTLMQKPASEPFHDMKPTGNSYYGDSPIEIRGRPEGDLMVRAVIVPELHVGPGRDYKTIQEAVDSAWEGWTIVVHEGTYNENITVNKSVTIRSRSGPAKTIVQTPPLYPDNNVFRITAGCVTISGLTIQGAVHNGRAGIYLDDVSNCVISGNIIQGNHYGVYVSEESTSNIILENEVRSNTNGVYINGSKNYVSGNNLHGNTALFGAAVFLSSVASGNRLLFNTIAVDPGTDPAVAAGPQVYNENSAEQVRAVENWWNTATGPSNAGGQGPAAGDNVLYDPWLTRKPVRIKTSPTAAGDYAVNARQEMNVTVLKQGMGTPMVSTASFGENPFGRFPGTPADRWIDVLLDSAAGVNQVEIRVHYTAEELAALGLKEGPLRLFWWNGEKWKTCSRTGVDKKNDFVWARLDLKTKPAPNDLTGTMFAVGAPKGGGFAWWWIPVIILIILVLLVVFRLIWILVVRRGRYAMD